MTGRIHLQHNMLENYFRNKINLKKTEFVWFSYSWGRKVASGVCWGNRPLAPHSFFNTCLWKYSLKVSPHCVVVDKVMNVHYQCLQTGFVHTLVSPESSSCPYWATCFNFCPFFNGLKVFLSRQPSYLLLRQHSLLSNEIQSASLGNLNSSWVYLQIDLFSSHGDAGSSDIKRLSSRDSHRSNQRPAEKKIR